MNNYYSVHGNKPTFLFGYDIWFESEEYMQGADGTFDWGLPVVLGSPAFRSWGRNAGMVQISFKTSLLQKEEDKNIVANWQA